MLAATSKENQKDRIKNHSNSGEPQKDRLYIEWQCQEKGTLASDMLYYQGVMSSPHVAQLYRMIVLHN